MFQISLWLLWNELFVRGTMMGINICSRLCVRPGAQGLL